MHHRDNMTRKELAFQWFARLAALLLILAPMPSMAIPMTIVYTGMPWDFEPFYPEFDLYGPDDRTIWEISFNDTALRDNLLTSSEMISWQVTTPDFGISSEFCRVPYTRCGWDLSLSFHPRRLEITDYSLTVTYHFTYLYTGSDPLSYASLALYDYQGGVEVYPGGSTVPGSWAVIHIPAPNNIWLFGPVLLGLIGMRSSLIRKSYL